MKKYRYHFSQSSSSPSTFKFCCDDLILRLDFVQEDIVRIALFRQGQPLLPTWSVAPGDWKIPPYGRDRLSVEGFPMYRPRVIRTDRVISFHMEQYQLILSLSPFALSLNKGEDRLFADRPFCAYNFNGELGEGSKHYITAEENEYIYGLGEKTGDVNRFGRSFVLGARDPMGYDARSTDPLYKHVPFYICENSTGCYGIYYDTHASGHFNFSQEIDNYYGRFKSFSCNDDALIYYVFLGNVRDITQNFACLCGRCAMPPKWSLDYCGSTMAYTEAPNANEQLLHFLSECDKNDIKCSGFYLSSGYSSKNGRRYVFTWNHDKIPYPDRLCRSFQEKQVNLIANIKPAFLTDHPLYDWLSGQGYFLHYRDGTPAVIPFWDGYGSYLDFTNPGAFSFWSDMVQKQLIDVGVSSTWNDNNEYNITDRSIYAHGFGTEIPAYRICQVFPMLMVMASYQAQTLAGQSRPMLSTRSGSAGLGRLAQTWTGDNRTAFSDLRYNHKMAMGMSLSGIYVFGHDLGGFAGPRPDPELFIRWLQYGVLMPRFCIHSWNEDGSATEPWTYPAIMDQVHAIFAMRQRIKPFLYDLLYKAHSQFRPFMVPVFYYYPDFERESDQFMLGTDVMACCVFDRNTSSVAVSLPENEGGWYHRDRLYGAGEHFFDCGLSDLPLLLHRAGSVFPEDSSAYLSNGGQKQQFTVYPLPHGSFTSEFFDDDGISDMYTQGVYTKIRFHVDCNEHTVSVSIEQEGDVLIKPAIHLIDHYQRKLIVSEMA